MTRQAPSLTTGDVGERVRQMRKDKGFSPAAMCERMAKSGYPIQEVTMYKWESGERAIPLAALPFLAHALSTTPGEMVSRMSRRVTSKKQRK